MGSTGQHFSNFRKSTPKSVQWLLLVAAIVIVIVLLLLLMNGQKKKVAAPVDDVFPTTPELRFEPNAPINWANTLIDETRDAEIKVYSNSRVQITKLVVQVEGEKDDDIGLSANATCTNDQTFVTEDTPCLIKLSYTPTHVIPRTNVGVAITWTAFDLGPDPIETPNAITAIIGAREKPKIEIAIPEPVAKPEPELVKEKTHVIEEPVDVEEAESEDIEEEPEEEFPDEMDSEFQEDIDDIAPAVNFFEPTSQSTISNVPAPSGKKYRSAFGNSCSDFSFPGYNMAGIQSGWIVPSGGAYYYHPFSDANCETATGIYNADTGYIMDITNPTRKIGSDVEHIRFTVRERVPQLQGSSKSKASVGRARQLTDEELEITTAISSGSSGRVKLKETNRVAETYMGSGFGDDGVVSSRPYDRTFVLRQYKPIPATIVSDIQADEKLLNGGLPVRATVDRNVYSDNGRTVILPTGTLMLGYVTGELPGPYKAVGKMQIEWYQFIRPDGVEFNFRDDKKRPFSADSQGRKGVPGHGSTDYLQQFVMPMLTAVVPAAVNLIAPISDSFVNQIDLDNNTVVQSGTVRSSEMAKNEIITAWNNVATKLLVDMLDNTTPPFSIAAGTRITVFSPVDLFVTCGQDDDEHNVNSKKCAFTKYPDGDAAKRADWGDDAKVELTSNLDELIGQVRSMMQSSLKEDCCDCKDGVCSADYEKSRSKVCANYSFTTLDFYCRSFGTYEAINNAKQKAVYENQKEKMSEKTNGGNVENLTKEYNTEVLGLKYDDDGKIKDPFKTEKKEKTPAEVPESSVITCDNGAHPDSNGCCPGETYTDMGDQGFNCCPDAGGPCFPPIEM